MSHKLVFSCCSDVEHQWVYKTCAFPEDMRWSSLLPTSVRTQMEGSDVDGKE